MKSRNKNQTRTSMSFWTALGLSANNLRTKKGRTIMTAFAGSIGIIGIALILALSSGVNDYIQSIQEDTLSEYPLQITNSALDISSLLASMTSLTTDEGAASSEDSEAEISVIDVMTSMFSQVNANDLEALKAYIESGESDIDSYVKAIEYTYDVEPLIYLEDGDSCRQVNPDTSMSSSSSVLSSLMSSGTSSFYLMPENESLYKDQYEVKAGHWPENYNECVLVLTSDGSISDYILYTLGLRDYSELETMIEQYNNGETVTSIDDIGTYTYDDVLGITFKVVCSADLYAYDSEYDVWVDKSDNETYMEGLVADGETLTIVGVVQPSEDAISAALSSGINYPMSLIYHMSELAASSDAVQAQMSDPDINIFTGEEFGADAEELDLSSLLTIDEDILSDAFNMDDAFADMELDFSDFAFDTSSLSLDASALDIDMSALDFDLSSMEFDMSSMDLSGMELDLSSVEVELPEPDLSTLLSGVTISTDSLSTLTDSLMDGYQAWMTSNGTDLATDFSTYLKSDAAKTVISDVLNNAAYTTVTVDRAGLTSVIESAMGTSETSSSVDSSAVTSAVNQYLSEHEEVSAEELDAVIVAAMEDGNSTSEVSAQDVADAVLDYISDNAVVSISDSGIQALADGLVNGYTSSLNTSFTEYLASDTAALTITAGVVGMLDETGMQDILTEAMNGYMEQVMAAYTEAIQESIQSQMNDVMEQVMTQMMSEVSEQLATQLSTAMESMMEETMTQLTEQLSASMETMLSDMMDEVMEQLSDSLTDSLSIDVDTLMDTFDFNMDSTNLTDLLTSVSLSTETSYDSNLNTLGYVDPDSPSEIDIYPLDFESKDAVVAILDNYNAQMEASGQGEKKITYTDMVATMMSSVTTIINTVSYVLIAFIAVSLVVSCIMISIITQISTMERTKEIGILRAMGASKGNISQVFNAETFIIGFCSGLIGVCVTELLIFPINAVIHSLVGDTSVNAVLPWNYALILVVISIVITVCSGLVPALNAAKQDPVTALRTE